MKVIQYNLITADGFIARNDGSEDFFPDEIFNEYFELCNKYGNTIMGRKTYEMLQSWGIEEENFTNTVKLVVSKNNLGVAEGYICISSPQEALNFLQEKGFETALLCSGSVLTSVFLKENLIDELLLTIFPLMIGTGKTLFTENFTKDLILQNVSTKDNLLKCHYIYQK